MKRARRHVRVPPDLTSLFDVLFIVIFAALIRAAAVQAAAQPPPKPPAPPVHLDPASLRARALAELDAHLAARRELIVRVSATGTITAVEADGTVRPVDSPLLEYSPNPDVGVAYLGDRAAELRVCPIAARHLGVPDLASYLVIIAPAQPLADLPHALYDGLHRDLDRCLADERGIGAIVDPVSPASAGSLHIGPVSPASAGSLHIGPVSPASAGSLHIGPVP